MFLAAKRLISLDNNSIIGGRRLHCRRAKLDSSLDRLIKDVIEIKVRYLLYSFHKIFKFTLMIFEFSSISFLNSFSALSTWLNPKPKVWRAIFGH